MKKDKKTLHLVLKKKWWDMIESGVKTEEYREIKQAWCSRLLECYKSVDWCTEKDSDGRFGCIAHGWKCSAIHDIYSIKHYKYVCFHKGYTANTMTFEIERISVGKGKPEWGAPEEEVFIIKLGKRV